MRNKPISIYMDFIILFENRMSQQRQDVWRAVPLVHTIVKQKSAYRWGAIAWGTLAKYLDYLTTKADEEDNTIAVHARA